MTIGIEVQRLFRRKKHGMEIVALEILRQLQRSDHSNQYTLFAKEDSDGSCFKARDNFSIQHNGMAAYPLWEQWYLPQILNRLKPDLLHCTANTAPLFCNIPLVITIHDVNYMESINFSGSSYQDLGNLYRRFIVPRVAKKAAIIVTVSEFEKKVIAARLQMPEEKIRVVYNGVNEQFRPIKDQPLLNEFRTSYVLPAKFLLHFGNSAPKKNTIGVLTAYKIYRSAVKNPLPLVLTDCKKEMIGQLLKQINAPELLEKIQVLDYVPFSSIPLLYNLATVFLYPSHRESFGLPVVEAMACGVPVITTNASALPEIAGGAACLVDSNNPGQIADKIIHLLSDADFYQDLRQKGFINATRFSWKIAAEQTLAIYNELVKKHRTTTMVLSKSTFAKI